MTPMKDKPPEAQPQQVCAKCHHRAHPPGIMCCEPTGYERKNFCHCVVPAEPPAAPRPFEPLNIADDILSGRAEYIPKAAPKSLAFSKDDPGGHCTVEPPRENDDYVAWLCWKGDQEHRHLILCDSDAAGAFKVYRRAAPDSGPPAPTDHCRKCGVHLLDAEEVGGFCNKCRPPAPPMSANRRKIARRRDDSR